MMTAEQGQFTSHDEFVQWQKERAEREAIENAERERLAAIDAENATFIERARQTIEQTKGFDWLNLKTLDDHPAVKLVRDARKAAWKAVERAEHALSDAKAALDAAESRAADGQRDETALADAHAAILAASSDHRIAVKALERADADVVRVRKQTEADAYVNLDVLHRAEIRALAVHLARAEPHSNAATDLEKASTRLFARPYDAHARPMAKPLQAASWKKEFNPKKGFYKYWREFYTRIGLLD